MKRSSLFLIIFAFLFVSYSFAEDIPKSVIHSIKYSIEWHWNGKTYGTSGNYYNHPRAKIYSEGYCCGYYYIKIGFEDWNDGDYNEPIIKCWMREDSFCNVYCQIVKYGGASTLKYLRISFWHPYLRNREVYFYWNNDNKHDSSIRLRSFCSDSDWYNKCQKADQAEEEKNKYYRIKGDLEDIEETINDLIRLIENSRTAINKDIENSKININQTYENYKINLYNIYKNMNKSAESIKVDLKKLKNLINCLKGSKEKVDQKLANQVFKSLRYYVKWSNGISVKGNYTHHPRMKIFNEWDNNNNYYIKIGFEDWKTWNENNNYDYNEPIIICKIPKNNVCGLSCWIEKYDGVTDIEKLVLSFNLSGEIVLFTWNSRYDRSIKSYMTETETINRIIDFMMNLINDINTKSDTQELYGKILMGNIQIELDKILEIYQALINTSNKLKEEIDKAAEILKEKEEINVTKISNLIKDLKNIIKKTQVVIRSPIIK